MAVRSFSIGHPEPRVVLSWRGISGRLDSAEKMRRRHAPPSPSCEPVTVLDPCTEFAAISECRYPRSLWCTRRSRKIPGHPLIRKAWGVHTSREVFIRSQDGAAIVYPLRSARYQFKYYGVL